MSRVDEAMRRAAARRGEEDSALGTAATTERPDIDTLARELYTEEQPAAAVASAPAASVIAAAPIPRPAPNVTLAPDARWARLDVRLTGKAVVDVEASPGSREQYRRLAASLHHAQAATGLKVVMVTSAAVGEGKTLTAANLALTLSESYQKTVLLIDADLRRPSVHILFRINNDIGLSAGLNGNGEATLPVQQVSKKLSILSAGRPTHDPIANLTSERMRRVVGEARDAFDWVILDTPPVALLPDANLLGAMTDGTVLVVKANTTSYQLVQRAVEAIGRDRVVGVVLNSAASGLSGTGGDDDYYYYYYSSQSADDVAPATETS